jgi:hypothetical protein
MGKEAWKCVSRRRWAREDKQQNNDDDVDVVINVIRWARIHAKQEREKERLLFAVVGDSTTGTSGS